jgi:hypothetical protein
MIFVNYKSRNIQSVSTAPPLEDILEDLYVNSTMCFPTEDESQDEFTTRIVTYLHADAEPHSASRSSRASLSSRSPRQKRAKRGSNRFEVSGIKFREAEVKQVTAMQNRWELFVLLGTGSRIQVHASCLVQFNDVYQTCEIHEVCVATTGQGLCKRLLTQVREYIRAGRSGTVKEVRIFCEKTNLAACKCYAAVFAGAKITSTVPTTGYVYTLH